MMYTLKERKLSLNKQYDVIVVGGGPAGCTAAVAAARESSKTLLIEATSTLGGMGTSGLVPAWCPFSDQEKIIYCGLAQKIFEQARAGMAHISKTQMDWVPIDSEKLKRIYDEELTKSGAEVLFNTALAIVDTKDNEINSIIVNNKGGLSAYQAKVFVDCTGDGDLAAWGGAEFQKGSNSGELQPATHCFIITNVDEYGFLHGGDEAYYGVSHLKVMKSILDSGKYPLINDNHLCWTIIGPRTVGFNCGHIWDVDNTNPASTSKALIIGRKLASQFRNALAEFFPKAFANSFLVSTGLLLGIRETRRIVGDYVLTLDDYLKRKSFPDEICRNSYFIDVHKTKNEKKMFSEKLINRQFRYEKGESHGIPYRCLTPKDLKNVLVAGRSISCDRTVNGSVRVMPVCLAMGEAAGMAAAIAATDDGDVHNIDIGVLRHRLKEKGAYLP